MNFTYDPDEFAINMNMYMNNDEIFSNSFSGKYVHEEFLSQLNV